MLGDCEGLDDGNGEELVLGIDAEEELGDELDEDEGEDELEDELDEELEDDDELDDELEEELDEELLEDWVGGVTHPVVRTISIANHAKTGPRFK